jgi:hypothetical protein
MPDTKLRLALMIVLTGMMLALSVRTAGGGADFVCKTTPAFSPACTAGYSAPPLPS